MKVKILLFTILVQLVGAVAFAQTCAIASGSPEFFLNNSGGQFPVGRHVITFYLNDPAQGIIRLTRSAYGLSPSVPPPVTTINSDGSWVLTQTSGPNQVVVAGRISGNTLVVSQYRATS